MKKKPPFDVLLFYLILSFISSIVFFINYYLTNNVFLSIIYVIILYVGGSILFFLMFFTVKKHSKELKARKSRYMFFDVPILHQLYRYFFQEYISILSESETILLYVLYISCRFIVVVIITIITFFFIASTGFLTSYFVSVLLFVLISETMDAGWDSIITIGISDDRKDVIVQLDDLADICGRTFFYSQFGILLFQLLNIWQLFIFGLFVSSGSDKRWIKLLAININIMAILHFSIFSYYEVAGLVIWWLIYVILYSYYLIEI